MIRLEHRELQWALIPQTILVQCQHSKASEGLLFGKATPCYGTVAPKSERYSISFSVCGLIIAGRSHHQITGDQMKFITICDYTGILECEIFAQTYRRFGLENVRNPVVEVEARVTPFESGLACTLDVLRIDKATLITSINLTVQHVAGGKDIATGKFAG